MTNTPDRKEANVQAYQEREGIALEKVAKNPERKTVAKLMLNRWETLYVQKNSTPKNVKLQKKSAIKTQAFNRNGMPPFSVKIRKKCMETMQKKSATKTCYLQKKSAI